MMNFNVDFAGLTIGVTTEYEYTYRFCRDYLTDGEPAFSVAATAKEIDEEIAISEFTPPRDYAESICIYREIAERLPLFHRCVFHGAVIDYKGCGVVFTAPSGTGKTTQIRLWQKYLGSDVQIVNGDKPILQIEDSVTAWATPYAGKEGYQNHGKTALKAICIVERSQTNYIKQISGSEYLTFLMNQIYRPSDMSALLNTLELMDKLLKNVSVYVLGCDISEEAVKTSFEALTGLDYNERKLPYED